ncbi:uncharacterized protein LOC143718571 isoform X2 [Siphateles boraxobius]|uniref:uncharacterized protein LOC143718571 isoform X2 n=1 Tax=Siphateles boraxobius TaxID=180520 RepID=UPI004064A4A6
MTSLLGVGYGETTFSPEKENMATHWVNGVKKRLKKPHDSRVHQDVVIIRGDAKEFMESYINEVQEKEHCYFRPPVCPRQDYYYYGCDRGNHAAGKSNGEATQTRANSCKAYISFKVITDAGISGAIIQKMLQYTGHDEANSKEKNRIHPDLHSLIEIWLQQGCSTSEILIKSCDWAQQNGHVDKKDRRFYLTPNDIRLLKKNLRGVGDSDSVSVDHLVSMELRDNICFYQPVHNEQPFILVVQTPFQKQLLEENPHPMVFMDASYKGITAYGYAFYALLLINKTGRGVPFAYFILSKETTETVSLCLQKLQLSNPSFYPRSVMMDRDLRVLNAIKSVFPNACTSGC